MDALQWMGAVRMRVQTADKNITIIHTTRVHQLMSWEAFHFTRCGVGEQVMGCYISPNLFQWSSTSWMAWGRVHFQSNHFFHLTIPLNVKLCFWHSYCLTSYITILLIYPFAFNVWKKAVWTFFKISPFVFHRRNNNFGTVSISKINIFVF